MISKITKGSNFHGLLNYLFSKPGAELFGSNVIADSALELANEMEESSLKSSKVQKPVAHFSLSVPPSDQLTNVDWLKIASDYMKEMGYDCNKYAVVHHTDREHDHIHIAACRVREDTGKCAEHDWDYRRSEAVLRKLEQDYNLTPTPGSQDKDRRSPTTGERRLLARTGEDSVRVKLQDTIDDLCCQQPTMPELIDLLKDQGVDVQVKETVNGSMGISYELDGIAFAGSKLGKAYTFNGLQKHRGVEYDPERDDDALAKLTEGIAQSANRPPVITSQNSTATGSTDGSDDDDNETIGAIAPTHINKVELPGQLPSLPELELELEAASNDEAASSETEKDDEKLNYADIFAVPDDFDREWILQQHREQQRFVLEKQAAEQERRATEAIESRRAEEQRIRDVYKENIDNPIFNQLIPDEVKALFEESIAQENSGAIAPNQLQLNDATAPEYASSFNHQTDSTDSTVQHQTAPTAPTVSTVPTELNQDDDDESVNVDPIEENWQPLRLYLIEDCCLPSDLLDALHEEGWVYANNEDMAVFSLRTLKNVETGVCVFDHETGLNDWRDLILEPDVEEEVNGEPAFFFIHPPNSELINKAILTSDPIEAISYAALDPSFGQNNTLYISIESVDSLPIEFLQKLEKNVVVSFKGDEDGLELAKDVMKVLPKSQKEELDQDGWNGMLKAHERSQQAEQMQLMAQYQSQQQSQMEL